MHFETILVLYWFVFFWRFLIDPLKLSTSELLSKHFPHWIHLGRELRKFRFPAKDNYFVYPACIPFLSMFYPPHLLSAFLGSFFRLNNAFRILVYSELIHYLLCSFLSFRMFSQWYPAEIALFGALTLTYMAYSIKLINPCIVYTIAWIPGMFIHGYMGSISLGMALLSGYYPVLIYIFPFAVYLNPVCVLGVILGLVQLIPMLWYWPKSVRHKTKISRRFGSVPAWRFLDLVMPGYVGQVRRLFHPESVMFLGWIPLLFIPFARSRAFFICLAMVIISTGVIKPLFRNPCRALYTFSFFLVWLAVSGLFYSALTPKQVLLLTFIQAYCLLANNRIYPMFPFTEKVRPSSYWFGRKSYDKTAYTYFTGYITGDSVPRYEGGFSLCK